MVRWQLFVSAGLIAGLGLAACGNSDAADGPAAAGSGGTAASPVPADQFAASFAQAQCASLGACCTEANHTFTDATCQSATTAKWQQKFDEDSRKAAVYDPAAAGECLNALKEQMICGNAYPAYDIPACQRIFAGTRADGEACTSDVECKSGHCFAAEGASINTCSPEPHYSWEIGKAGDKCLVTCNDVRSCFFGNFPSEVTSIRPGVCLKTDGLYCDDKTDSDWVCKPLAAEGEHCSWSGCQKGSYCAYLPGGVTTKSLECMPQRPTGAACNDDFECLSGYCEDFRFCAVNSVSEELCAKSTP